MARPFKLECIRCRYDLTGLSGDGECPECGLDAARSTRFDRPGTPWQRLGGMKGWWLTLMMVCRRPGALWDGMRIDKRGAEALEITSVFLGAASGVIAVALLGTTRMVHEFNDWLDMLAVVIEFLFLIPLLVIALFGLNWIARTVMLIVLRARGEWLSVAAGQTIVGHISTVWVLITPCVALLTIHRMSDRRHGGVSDLAVISGLQFSVMPGVRFAGVVVLIAGLCVFAVGLWTGARELREEEV